MNDKEFFEIVRDVERRAKVRLSADTFKRFEEIDAVNWLESRTCEFDGTPRRLKISGNGKWSLIGVEPIHPGDIHREAVGQCEVDE